MNIKKLYTVVNNKDTDMYLIFIKQTYYSN